jgi:hypothetical protein
VETQCSLSCCGQDAGEIKFALAPACLQVGGLDAIWRNAPELEDDCRAVMTNGRELPRCGSRRARQEKGAADGGRERFAADSFAIFTS